VDLVAIINCMMNPSSLIMLLVNTLKLTMLLFLLASGLSLIFGTLEILNFAHGSLYMIGSYLTYVAIKRMSGYAFALVFVCLAMAIFGFLLERLLVRRIYGASLFYQLLLTYGLVLVLDDVVKLVWGSEYLTVEIPQIFQRKPIVFMGSVTPFYSAFTIVVGAVVALFLWIFFTRTKLGKTISAMSEDQEMLQALGINVPLLYSFVFALGTCLAGLGGILSVPLLSAYPGMGFSVIIYSFIVVVIGGLGDIRGAFVGAFLLGLVKSMAVIGFRDYEELAPFALMVIVLVLRPQGLFGIKHA